MQHCEIWQVFLPYKQYPIDFWRQAYLSMHKRQSSLYIEQLGQCVGKQSIHTFVFALFPANAIV